MTNTFEKRKEEFATECKVINLRYEYEGYTGKERYAIVRSNICLNHHNTLDEVP